MRPSSKARGGSIPAVFDRRATPLGGMQRRPNVRELVRLGTSSPWRYHAPFSLVPTGAPRCRGNDGLPGGTPPARAVASGERTQIRMLLDRGTDLKETGGDGWRVVIWAYATTNLTSCRASHRRCRPEHAGHRLWDRLALGLARCSHGLTLRRRPSSGGLRRRVARTGR